MPDQKMVYESMEAMSKSFDNAGKQIQEMNQAIAQVAGKLEGGALNGKGGDIFASALKETLKKKLDTMAEAMQTLSGDIKGAMAEMKQVEQQDTKVFKG
jgi:WXG100 family type VII secretion target